MDAAPYVVTKTCAKSGFGLLSNSKRNKRRPTAPTYEAEKLRFEPSDCSIVTFHCMVKGSRSRGSAARMRPTGETRLKGSGSIKDGLNGYTTFERIFLRRYGKETDAFASDPVPRS